MAVDSSCVRRWVQAYAPELNKRCRPHLKPTNKSYRTDETYIKAKGEDHLCVPWTPPVLAFSTIRDPLVRHAITAKNRQQQMRF